MAEKGRLTMRQIVAKRLITTAMTWQIYHMISYRVNFMSVVDRCKLRARIYLWDDPWVWWCFISGVHREVLYGQIGLIGLFESEEMMRERVIECFQNKNSKWSYKNWNISIWIRTHFNWVISYYNMTVIK